MSYFLQNQTILDQAKYPVVMVIIHRDTSILQTGILETTLSRGFQQNKSRSYY
ncbi:hypothetical protein [Massilibacteroides sp.]|uniref:hypothetical protein n=1 Tax=Massilibacteroides sp. TaxID=2034766 RepID=UPI00260ED970|nr:hypothetical protein [Massilibacteroides sp.]MDD4515196.1 hypothetical protein [Massilibacteroides sp.]